MAFTVFSKTSRPYGSWMIQRRKLQYKNPWIEVYEDDVIRPDGNKGIHVFMSLKPGVSIFPLDSKGNVYLTKEFHYGVGKVTIEAVAGGVDKGEEFLQAAQRELAEELGIKAQEWIDLGSSDPLTGYLHCPHKLYLARKLIFGKQNMEGSESIESIKVSLAQAVEMVMASEITNSISCALILKAWQYLQQEQGTKNKKQRIRNKKRRRRN